MRPSGSSTTTPSTGPKPDAGMGVGVGVTPNFEPAIMAGSDSRTVRAQTANPNPSIENPAPASRTTDVLMPTISPANVKSGPPLLPGLMAASVWTIHRPAS